jgi:C-terminal processing protease CtpA/Prc
MQENSKFVKSNLKVGMKILTINETPCPEMVKEFKALVAEMDGKVTIVAELDEIEGEERVVASIYKETKTEPLGIYLKKKILKEGLYISEIKEDSKFGNTDLKVGMKIVEINDQPCPQTVLEFRTLLAEIDGEVTIAAEPVKMRIIPEPPSEVAVPETSGRTSKKVSFADEASEGANAKVMEDPAEAENDILQEFVTEKLDDPCTPRIFAYNGEERKEVVCTIRKRENESLGLLLREFKGEEGVHVLQMNQRSQLASTALQPGMTILKINGKECPKGADECIKMLRSITGLLQIVASELVEE